MALTKEQNTNLAGSLNGTTNNVYRVAQSMFDHDFNDEDFDRLYADTGLFRCEECSTWKDRSEEDPGVKGLCSECLDRM